MNITTLDQAASHLMEVGAVDVSTMTVEGKRLLEVCGLDAEKAAQSIARQIDKHGFELEKDFCTSMGKSTGGRTPTVYHFTLNAANHVLLAAMTEKGKAARQDAIDMKVEQQYQIPQTYAAALLEAGRLAMELEQSQAQLAIAAPKAEFVDRYVESTGNLGFRQVAKLLKVKETDLREFLICNKVMYRLAGVMTPYADHIDAGRFVVKAGMAEHGDSSHAYSQAKFTPKGVEWLAGELAKHEAKKLMEVE
ncbi:phage antirepressor KilAC domain-containing protein [Pseudomonas sp.]|uniref:phage antirepressor KilAC domain-containing protein n=1 Tax=Pseudomonas sp. TaxID=306 RepID=UPI0025891342|nr:phage antirepressor KilAC domain-containing protein [Pseudomonas sp.]